MFQKNVVQKIKTLSVFNNFLSEHGAVSEIMWKNMPEPGRPQITM
jgi:nicotinamide mononucleotide (NMN) deamidase PncC